MNVFLYHCMQEFKMWHKEINAAQNKLVTEMYIIISYSLLFDNTE